jgi:hypothetical protein
MAGLFHPLFEALQAVTQLIRHLACGRGASNDARAQEDEQFSFVAGNGGSAEQLAEQRYIFRARNAADLRRRD